jgi:hypothetical protein
MSNMVTSYILVHDGGKLTVEDVNLAVHGIHPLPVHDGGGENYYTAHQNKDSEWIVVRTKWSAPVGAIAQLAYERRINVTMEFDSLDNAEVGSMQFFHQTMAPLEDGVSLLDYYRPNTVPQEVLEMAKKFARSEEEETRKAFGVEEAQ